MQCRDERELADIRALEDKHEEEGEQLRVQWQAELKKWAADVAMLREHLLSNHNIPDAPWLAGYR